MATSAASLIEQVRSRLLDYGNATTTLAAAVSDTTTTTISLESVGDIAPKHFLMVDNEMVEVRAVYEGTPPTATVIRGARGSTAATHTSGTVVRIEPVFGNHEYLQFLNQALDASFPSLYSVLDTAHHHSGTCSSAGNTTTMYLASGASSVNDYYNGNLIYFTAGTGVGQSALITDYVGSTKAITHATVATGSDTTTTYRIGSEIASDTYEYEIPSTIGRLARVEIETSTAGVYEVSRNWDYQDGTHIILEDSQCHSTGRNIRFIGYAKFDALTLAGNLDTDFPETNATAMEYLIVKSCAHVLRARQAPIARRDSFIGITDSFQQAQPFMSTLSAKDFENQAASLLRQCRMPRLPEYCSDPGRVYYGRP